MITAIVNHWCAKQKWKICIKIIFFLKILQNIRDFNEVPRMLCVGSIFIAYSYNSLYLCNKDIYKFIIVQVFYLMALNFPEINLLISKVAPQHSYLKTRPFSRPSYFFYTLINFFLFFNYPYRAKKSNILNKPSN